MKNNLLTDTLGYTSLKTTGRKIKVIKEGKLENKSWEDEFEKKYYGYITHGMGYEIKLSIQSLLDNQEAKYKKMVKEMIGGDISTNLDKESEEIFKEGYKAKRQEIINIAKKYKLYEE